MTKKLTELFNLDTSDSDITDDDPPVQLPTAEQQLILSDLEDTLDKIDVALPTVRGLDASDQEMDDLADLAKTKFEDLMDLGMNVESRFSGQIFQTAGVLLGHAITAKQAKLDKKLRMIDLQLKKMRLDHQMQTASEDSVHSSIDGEGTVIDRNTLLAQILNKPK
jgi:hypothetical protein